MSNFFFEVRAFWSITAKESMYSGSYLHSNFLGTWPKDCQERTDFDNGGVAQFLRSGWG